MILKHSQLDKWWEGACKSVEFRSFWELDKFYQHLFLGSEVFQ